MNILNMTTIKNGFANFAIIDYNIKQKMRKKGY